MIIDKDTSMKDKINILFASGASKVNGVKYIGKKGNEILTNLKFALLEKI